ncbi:MAG: transglycosylase domain-containing protein [Terricaulis sp.]
MRAGFAFVFILMALALIAPIVVAVNFWMDAGDMVARAERAGDLRPGYGLRPLWSPERVIAADQFAQTWGGQGAPCRTLALMWTDFTDPDAHPPAMPVSQRAATAILGDRRGTSVRWQMRRLLVACQLERRFNDGQLERIWLAHVNFGAGAIGLDKAATANFSKPAASLDPLESAKLAVLLHDPTLRTQPDRWNVEAQKILARVAARRR